MQQQQYTTLQQLLIDEIINKGYDQEEFQDFIVQMNSDKGENLDEWSYDELFNVVSQFQQLKSQEQTRIKIKQNDIEDETEIVDQKTIQNNVKGILLSEFVIVQPYTKIVQCKQFNSKLNDETEWRFTICDPIERQGGLFQFFKTDIYFPIFLNNSQKAHMRTVQDFIQFRKALTAEFPEFIIPQICIQSDYAKPSNKENTKKQLKEFLEIFNQNKTMRPSETVQIFLFQDDPKKLRKFLDREFKVNPLLSHKLAQNLKIELSVHKCQISKEIDYYVSNNFKLFAEVDQLLLKFDQQMKKGIATLKTLKTKISNINLSLPSTQGFKEFGNILYMLINYCGQYVDNFQQQAQYIKDFSLKKYNSYYHPLKEILNNQQITLQNYIQSHQQLDLKKKEYFQKQNFDEWELTQEQLQEQSLTQLQFKEDLAKSQMLPKQTQKLNLQLDYYAYLTDQIGQEVDKLFQRLNKDFIEECNQLIQNNKNLSKSNNEKWEQFLQELNLLQV